MQRMLVWPLARELRSHMPSDAEKKIKKKNKKHFSRSRYHLLQKDLSEVPVRAETLSNKITVSQVGEVIAWSQLSRSVISDSLRLHGLYSPPGFPVHGTIQVRIPEWVVIFYCKGSSGPRDRAHVFCVSCTGKWILYHCATRVPTWPFTKCVTLSKLDFLSFSPSTFRIR